MTVSSRPFRQGMNFLIRGEVRNRCPYEVRDVRVTLEAVDGQQRPLERAEYGVSPVSLAPGAVAGNARASWSHE